MLYLSRTMPSPEPVIIPADISTETNARTIHKIWAHISNDFAPDDSYHTSYTFRDPYNSAYEANGKTGFGRHNDILRLLPKTLAEAAKDAAAPIRIFAGPCSVACETYKLSAFARDANLPQTRDFRIDALDRSETFTALARLGAYPSEIVSEVQEHLQDILFSQQEHAAGLRTILDEVRSNVCFLEPQRIEDFCSEERYDAVVMNNLFWYLNPGQQRKVIGVLGRMQADIIVMTKDENDPGEILDALPYMQLKDHPVWADTVLARDKEIRASYYLFARKEPSPNYTL